MRVFKRGIGVAFLAVLAACAGTPAVHDSNEEVAKWAYTHDAPASVTLITMVNNKTGRGGHSSLMINGRQRTMYDPAGRWHNSQVPEQDDVLFGITPAVLKLYNSFHARKSHHVVLQTKDVSPDLAERLFQSARVQGRSLDAMCSNNVTAILADKPGFEAVGHTFFPVSAMNKFQALPGVKTEKVYEEDEGQN